MTRWLRQCRTGGRVRGLERVVELREAELAAEEARKQQREA